MADTVGGEPHDPGVGARVAKLEVDVAHIRGDLAEVRSLLNRLAPRIDEMHGFLIAKLPDLVTRADLADLRHELRLDMLQRPTRRQSILDIFAIAGFIGVVLTAAARFAH